MTRYIIRRGLQSIVLVFITTLIAFSIYQIAPGGPLQFLDDDPTSSSVDKVRLERLYGLDRAVPIQYAAWLTGEDWMPQTEAWRSGQCLNNPAKCSRGIVRLDFGRSFSFQGESVIGLIAERIPATFTLGFASLVLSMAVGIPLGIIAAYTSRPLARQHHPRRDRAHQHGARLVVGPAPAHHPGRLLGRRAIGRHVHHR
ncbi:MAG: ABC transporter permease [Caldilineaceae bacterium]